MLTESSKVRLSLPELRSTSKALNVTLVSSEVYPDAVTPTNCRLALPAVSSTLLSAKSITVSD